MPEAAATTAASANRSSKNTTPTGRSSGTGSNSSTNTPPGRKKKSGGEQHEAGSGGIAGLFASLCGGSKAKRAFDDGGSSAVRNTTAKPATTVRRLSQSKALPAAPVTTKEVASDVEVSTTKRLSTTEPGPSSPSEGITSGAIGASDRSALRRGDTEREAIGGKVNENTPVPATQKDRKSGLRMPLGEDTDIERITTNSTGSKAIAPVILAGGAIGLGAASLNGVSKGTHNTAQDESGNTKSLIDHRQDMEAVTQQFDRVVVPNEALVSTGHPLPLDEVGPFLNVSVCGSS